MSATGTPAGPAMRADARRNRQRLLDAALQVYAERGADDASLDEIARRAGVGIGTLYRHFPTRRALLEAVYRDQVEELCAVARELKDQAPPEQALEGWLRALMAFGTTKRTCPARSCPARKRPRWPRRAAPWSARRPPGCWPRRSAPARSAGTWTRPTCSGCRTPSLAADPPHSHPDQGERLMSVLLAGLARSLPIRPDPRSPPRLGGRPGPVGGQPVHPGLAAPDPAAGSRTAC